MTQSKHSGAERSWFAGLMMSGKITKEQYCLYSKHQYECYNALENRFNVADDSINSEHYVDGSIDTAHIADDQVTEAKMADDAIGSAQLKTLSTLLIKNSSGSTLKTVHGAGA